VVLSIYFLHLWNKQAYQGPILFRPEFFDRQTKYKVENAKLKTSKASSCFTSVASNELKIEGTSFASS